MTSTQMTILLGTIYIAPYLNKHYSLSVGCILLIIAAVKELGLI